MISSARNRDPGTVPGHSSRASPVSETEPVSEPDGFVPKPLGEPLSRLPVCRRGHQRLPVRNRERDEAKQSPVTRPSLERTFHRYRHDRYARSGGEAYNPAPKRPDLSVFRPRSLWEDEDKLPLPEPPQRPSEVLRAGGFTPNGERIQAPYQRAKTPKSKKRLPRHEVQPLL